MRLRDTIISLRSASINETQRMRDSGSSWHTNMEKINKKKVDDNIGKLFEERAERIEETLQGETLTPPSAAGIHPK